MNVVVRKFHGDCFDNNYTDNIITDKEYSNMLKHKESLLLPNSVKDGNTMCFRNSNHIRIWSACYIKLEISEKNFKRNKKLRNITHNVLIILTALGALSAIYSGIFLTVNKKQNEIQNTKDAHYQNNNIKPQSFLNSKRTVTIKPDSLKKGK